MVLVAADEIFIKKLKALVGFTYGLLTVNVVGSSSVIGVRSFIEYVLSSIVTDKFCRHLFKLSKISYKKFSNF